jgi:hypothetical protein
MTFNRGKLLRLAKAGKLIKVGSYHFDDQTGQEMTSNQTPVNVMQSCNDFKEGCCNVFEHDFKTKSGMATQEESGLICLYVHSNCNYDFRITP